MRVAIFLRAMMQLLNHWPGYTARTLSLKSRVSNMIFMIEQLLESTDYFALAQPEVRFDVDMCRQGCDVRANGPDVQVVNVVDAINIAHPGNNFVNVDVRRHPFEQNMARFTQNTYSSPADNDDNHHGDQRVE